MHAERLTTRVNMEGFPGEACLLIYDALQLNSTMLGDDVRELLDSRPGIARIYLLAPFVSESELRSHLLDGVMLMRLSSYFQAIGGRVCLLSFFEFDDKKQACEIPFLIDEDGQPQEEPAKLVDAELRHGWLFDLFDRCRGRVDAPTGVHFAKSSGRHSSKFLRVSNVLLSSAACAAVAYFTLGSLCCGQARRIFVDTAPLLAVAAALQRIAISQGLWELYAPVNSFSSYGGIDKLPKSSGRDLILVSASTSGGLVKELKDHEFDVPFIATLFYLGPSGSTTDLGATVCDLTFRQGRLFGYPLFDSYPANNCPLCKKGHFLAELEGDQFQLEKRAKKFLDIKKPVQTLDARETLELLARNGLIRVATYRRAGESSDFVVDADVMLQTIAPVRQRLVRALRRFTPLPLSYVVLVGIHEEAVRSVIAEAGLENAFEGIRILGHADLGGCASVTAGAGGALVIFGALSNFSTARDINAQLRIKCPMGCVAYLAALTIANSSEHLADLKMFLTYGELGLETFTYSSASSLMLPAAESDITAWEAEEQMLARLRDNEDVPCEISSRLEILRGASDRSDRLLWEGRQGELSIQNDFVFLSIDDRRSKISQADILATIANVLATARADSRGLKAQPHNGQEPIRWHQSVYGHVMLHPSAFEKFNDAILLGAFLRLATPAELNYSTDIASSNQVLTVIRAAITAWPGGGGDSLAEFLVALATHRLLLCQNHIQEIKSLVRSLELPSYLCLIANVI